MRLLVSALEPSANLHLKTILDTFSKPVEICGIFDSSLGSPLYPSSDFGVMGIFSVIPKILKAKRAVSKMVELVESCDKVLLIDSPAFNLPLAKAIKKRFPKKEIIYYILPKIWAWNSKRKRDIERYIDVQISIFPFEKKHYPNSLYFGNPLYREDIPFSKEGRYIAFLPGSRKSEILHLMPLFREIAKRREEPKILVVPPYMDISIYGDISEFEIWRNTQEALVNSKFAYICSGTATLEASIIGTPFVLVYRTNPIEYWIGKRVVQVPYIGLANIIFYEMDIGKEFHREYIQSFDIDKLADEVERVDRKEFLENSKVLRKLLQGDIRDVGKVIEG